MTRPGWTPERGHDTVPRPSYRRQRAACRPGPPCPTLRASKPTASTKSSQSLKSESFSRIAIGLVHCGFSVEPRTQPFCLAGIFCPDLPILASFCQFRGVGPAHWVRSLSFVTAKLASFDRSGILKLTFACIYAPGVGFVLRDFVSGDRREFRSPLPIDPPCDHPLVSSIRAPRSRSGRPDILNLWILLRSRQLGAGNSSE